MSEGKEVKLNVVKLVLAVQLVVFGMIGLDKIGIDVPILQKAVVFIYLMFIPGLLILKNLELEVATNPIELLLLSIATSISVLTILSALENIALSPFYDRPISKVPLMVTIYGFTIFLTLICLYRRNQYLTLLFNLQQVRLLLFSLFLPLLMILGRIGENNILIFITLVVISILPVTITLRKMDERMYPFIIWIISLCLVILARSPAGAWKTGEVVKIAEIWDPSHPLTHNSLLFPVLLHPVFSILTEVDIAVVTNIVDTLLVSLIPVVLYVIYNKFFFSSLFVFGISRVLFLSFLPTIIKYEQNRLCFPFCILTFTNIFK